MLLYNVTITIDKNVAEDWLHWMKTEHLRDVMATGMFKSYRMSRLLNHEHQDAEIYTMQYLTKDSEHLQRYQNEFAPELQKHIQQRFAGKFAAFRTIMEVIEEN